MTGSSDSSSHTFRTTSSETLPENEPFSESGIIIAGLACAIAFHCGVLLNLYSFDWQNMILALSAFIVGAALNSLMAKTRKFKNAFEEAPAALAMIAVIASAVLLVLSSLLMSGITVVAQQIMVVVSLLLLGFFLEGDIVTLIGYEQNLKQSLKRGTIEKSFILAALFAFAISLFAGEFRLPALGVLAIATSVFTFIIHSRHAGLCEVMEPAITASDNYYLNRRMAVLAIIISAALAFCFVVVSGRIEDVQRCVAALALVALAAILLAFAHFRHLPQFSETVSIALVAVVLCLLLLITQMMFSTGIVFVVAFTTFEMMLLMTMIGTLNTIGRFHLDFISYFLTSRGRYLLGFLIGSIIGVGAVSVPALEIPAANLFGFAIAVSVASIIAPLGTRTAHGVLRQGFEKTEYFDDSIRDRSFEQSCESVGEKYGLTERETEVFAMLAQGLNVPVIAEKLVVSESTVKSHSANIYRKCNVHSKQQIIAMVLEGVSGNLAHKK